MAFDFDALIAKVNKKIHSGHFSEEVTYVSFGSGGGLQRHVGIRHTARAVVDRRPELEDAMDASGKSIRASLDPTTFSPKLERPSAGDEIIISDPVVGQRTFIVEDITMIESSYWAVYASGGEKSEPHA